MCWVMGLKYWGIACRAADFLLEQNVTKYSIISFIPQPKFVLMKVCFWSDHLKPSFFRGELLEQEHLGWS